MDCGNFCISRILAQRNHDYEESDFIFSETLPGATLLSKIWFFLLNFFDNVEIVHENGDIFVNLNKDEIPLLNEYKYRLKQFQNKWGIFSSTGIYIGYLKEKLKEYYCIIPIKKREWSHLVILRKFEYDDVCLVDNKKWEYTVTKEKFEDLINLHNWKYVLFCKY